jgi:UDP-glucose 4-epimerase
LKRVLITGAAGFLGRNLARYLGSHFELLGVDLADGFDVCDPAAFERLPGSFDAVVHLAGLTFVPESHERPRDYYHVNLLSALNTAEFCRRRAVRVLIFPNTYVYGPPRKLPVDEDHPLVLPSPYHKSKKLAEDLLLGYFEAHQTKVVVFRVFNLYGPGQSDRFLIPGLLAQALRGNKVKVLDLEPRRDFLHIDDFVRLVGAVVGEETPAEGVYNVGTGRSYSVAEVVNLLATVLGRPLEMEDLGQRRKNEIMDCYADISKAKSTFGWQPRVSLEEGLTRLVEPHARV